MRSGRPRNGTSDQATLDALAAARALAVRVGEDSNLTLDPELDTYYLQDTAVLKIPALLGYLGERRSLTGDPQIRRQRGTRTKSAGESCRD